MSRVMQVNGFDSCCIAKEGQFNPLHQLPFLLLWVISREYQTYIHTNRGSQNPWDFLGDAVVKKNKIPLRNETICVKALLVQESRFDWEDLLEEEMATHSSILAWKIPWTEQPGGLQFIGLQRVGHNLVTEHAHMAALGHLDNTSQGQLMILHSCIALMPSPCHGAENVHMPQD